MHKNTMACMVTGSSSLTSDDEKKKNGGLGRVHDPTQRVLAVCKRQARYDEGGVGQANGLTQSLSSLEWTFDLIGLADQKATPDAGGRQEATMQCPEWKLLYRWGPKDWSGLDHSLRSCARVVQ